jgi:hypothetical protein
MRTGCVRLVPLPDGVFHGLPHRLLARFKKLFFHLVYRVSIIFLQWIWDDKPTLVSRDDGLKGVRNQAKWQPVSSGEMEEREGRGWEGATEGARASRRRSSAQDEGPLALENELIFA